MASWVLAHPPWHSIARLRSRWDVLAGSGARTRKHLLNTHTFSLGEETPAMREMKAYPYPSMPPDEALFEECTDEYSPTTLLVDKETISSSKVGGGRSPCAILRKLVHTNQFEDAARVYDELVEMGQVIQLHPVYHFIARNVLSKMDIPSHERLVAFNKWWSLVPPSTQVNSARSVSAILSETLRKDHILDLPLIARFALLAASKGYANQVGADSIRILARYAPPEFTIGFLETFCITTWDYRTSLDEYKRSPETVAKDMLECQFRAWYSLAVRTFASAENFDPALRTLNQACERDIHVYQGTYAYLLWKLQAAGNKKGEELVETLRKKNNPVNQDPNLLPLEFVPERRLLTDSMSLGQLKRSPASLNDLAQQLEQAYREGIPVSATSVEKFIRAGLDTGRTDLVRNMRDLAYQSGPSSISTWALAEMLHYHYPKLLTSFLRVYEHNFHLVGVPPEIFDAVRKAGHRLAVPEIKRLRSGLPALGNPPPLHRRLDPSSHHVYVLWRMVVRDADRPATLVRLYRSFIEAVAASRSIPKIGYPLPRLIQPAPQTPQDVNLDYMKPIPPRSLYDIRFFNIFIGTFTHFGFVSHTTRVILDLFRLGFKADDSIEKAFSNSLQFKPGLESVTKLLFHWENLVEHVSSRLDDPWDEADAKIQLVIQESREMIRRRMLIFFYRTALRKLVRERRREDALEVAKHFQEVIPFTAKMKKALRKELNRLPGAHEPAPAPKMPYYPRSNPRMRVTGNGRWRR